MSRVEALLQRRFWILELAFIAAAAFVLAGMAGAWAEQLIWTPPRPPKAWSTARATPATARAVSLDGTRLAGLFGLPSPAPATAAAVAPAPELDPDAEPVRTTLPLRLLGTLVAGDSKWSLAAIEDHQEQKEATYMVGDTIRGARVLGIERERVVILADGRREFIDGTRTGAPPPKTVVSAVKARAAQVRGRPQTTLGTSIRATGPNEYEIPKTEVDAALNNLSQLATKARIVPAFKNGAAVGFKLFAIRPNSLYSKIGIRNGDIIRRINGFDLNSPEKALEVYTRLRDSARIDVELERRGKILRNTYNIR